MRSLAWVVSHVAALVGIHLLVWGAADGTQYGLLYAMPLTTGTVQWAFLAGRLRWWGALWLPACLAGLFLSFLGCWLFLAVLGAGLGAAQAPVLAAAGFRRWWVWVPASGLGWLVGLLLGSAVLDLLGSAIGTDGVRMTVLYGVTGLGYGTLTAAALGLMPRATATRDPAPDANGGW